MKGLLTIILLFIVSSWYCQGQTVQVLNAKSGKPVEGVLLYNEKQSVITDESGKISIDNFYRKSIIHFKHSSYLSYSATPEKIVRQGKIILLVEDPVRIDEIIVSANRWEQSKAEIPHTIKSIQAEEVLHSSPQTAADLLGTQGGVFIQKSQMGGGSPMIRGFSANRVLIVVDGIRMNNAIFRSGNLHNVISLDALSLENTEVIFGPGSVIYGSDALGGVMSFNTLKPKLSTKTDPQRSGKVYSRTSSANMEKTIHASYNFGSKKWAAVISGTFSDYGNLRMGSRGPEDYLRERYVENAKFVNDNGIGMDKVITSSNNKIQKYTGYNQLNLLGRLRFRPNEHFDFIISAHLSETGDIPRYDRLIQENTNIPIYARWYYGPQKWNMVSGQLQYAKEHSLFDKISILAGYQQYEESRHDRKLNSSDLRSRKEKLDIFSLNVDFGKSLDKKNELFYGIESNHNKIFSSGESNNLLTGMKTAVSPRYPNESAYSSLAGYYSYKYILNKKFIFQAGSRFTFTHMEGNFDNVFFNFPFDGFNMNNSAFNGNLGIVWHPTQDWQVNIHSSTGFRSPNIDDVAKIFDSEPGHVIVPNPDLKPEYARNLELSIMRGYTHKARIEVTGFYTWLKNAMVRRPFQLNEEDFILYDGTMSRIEALVNAESATIIGTNLSLYYIFSPVFRTQNDLTITTGEDSEGLPLRHVPPVFGSSHLIYEYQKLYLDLNIIYNGQLSNDKLAPDEKNKPHLYLADKNGHPYAPSWWTLNLKTSYKVNRRITLGGGIENMLDKRYRAYSSGIVAPGVNFILSLSVKF